MAETTVARRAPEQPTPSRELIAAQPVDRMMDEALRRARRIDELDEATRRAASHVRPSVKRAA
jgi:hypothetical protein